MMKPVNDDMKDKKDVLKQDKREDKDAFKQGMRDKKEAFREQMRTYRQGDRLGPRPVRPEFNKPAPAVTKPAVTTAPVAAPAAPATATATTAPAATAAPATMKKGGKVKCMSKGGSTASKRADGCATKGKTRGRII